jgi:hypothetical protein
MIKCKVPIFAFWCPKITIMKYFYFFTLMNYVQSVIYFI